MVEENKELDIKLAKMILGNDDTCQIEAMGYRFKIHCATMQDLIQINIVSNNLRAGVFQSDLDLKVLTTMIATFDVLCEEVVRVKDKDGRDINPIEVQTVKDSKGNVIRNIKFWEFLQNKKNPRLFETLVVQMYEQYMSFQNEIAIKYDDLKN